MSYQKYSTSMVSEPQADLDPYNLTRYESRQTRAIPESHQSYACHESVSSNDPCTESSLAVSRSKLPAFHTDFELSNRIITSTSPLDLPATSHISIQHNTGLHLNEQEDQQWRGTVELSEYPMNVDPTPEVVYKKFDQTVNYVQPITIKYLKPPPISVGSIEIRKEPDFRVPKAPPVIIRQRPVDPVTPASLVFREQPPTMPTGMDHKCIVVSGEALPAPPRRLIIERMAVMPERPPEIVIEKWLPYGSQNRKVTYKEAAQVTNYGPEKNLIINWCPPNVKVTKELHNLGTVLTNPDEYQRLYGNSLLTSSQIDQMIRQHGINLPVTEPSKQPFETPALEGDIFALNLIDLDRWGLSQYKHYLKQTPGMPMMMPQLRSEFSYAQ